MSKFSKENKKDKERKVILSITIEPSKVALIQGIHENVSEWIRDAIDEKFINDNNKINGVK
jgi:hypothetical protein